jgi:hypothetical protein
MVVNAIVKTYASDPGNTVYIFTTSEAAELIKAQDAIAENIQYVLMGANESATDFLNRAKTFQLDRIHLTTVTKFFKSFYFFNPGNTCQLFFHFHNIELWFESSVSIQAKRLWKVFSHFNKEVKIIRQLKYSLKDIWWDYYRKKFIKKIGRNGTGLIILSEAQRFHLNKYLDASPIVIVHIWSCLFVFIRAMISKWVIADPNAKLNYIGEDGAIGFISQWESELKNVGIGEQEIMYINENDSYQVEIRFKKPFEGVSQAITTTEAISDKQTKVTTTFLTSTPFPMNVMVPFISKMLKKDMDGNMVRLKANLEA